MLRIVSMLRKEVQTKDSTIKAMIASNAENVRKMQRHIVTLEASFKHKISYVSEMSPRTTPLFHGTKCLFQGEGEGTERVSREERAREPDDQDFEGRGQATEFPDRHQGRRDQGGQSQTGERRYIVNFGKM